MATIHIDSTTTPATSIGMKVDSIIAQLESIPQTVYKTYAYYAFVLLCCLFSFFVLNYSNNPTSNSNTSMAQTQSVDLLQKKKKKKNVASSNATAIHTTTNTTANANANANSNANFNVNANVTPQPKWHILKFLNILSVILLLTSFGWFASNASTYLNDSHAMVKFMAVWSMLICYFFGFFGMSFIDEDELERVATAGADGVVGGGDVW